MMFATCVDTYADERIMFEHGNHLNDFLDTRRRILYVVLREVIENAIDVISDLGRQLDLRHPQRASFSGHRPGLFCPQGDSQE